MNKTRKLASLLLALVMVLGMVGSAMAEDTYSITINGKAGHTYEVYQIFTGDLSGNVLSNIVWGDGVSATAKSALGEASTVADGLTNDNVREFSDTLDTEDYLVNPTTMTANGGTYTAEGLEAGYYLIKDKDETQEGNDGTYTAYMLKVVKNVVATPKDSVPTVDKSVTEQGKNAEDVNIGDEVTFILKATLGNNIDQFETYKLVFHDTLSSGLTFKEYVSATLDGTNVKANFIMSAEGSNLEFTCTDVIALGADDGSEIIITYTATLNANATVGSAGNENKVYLEYSNDPSHSGEGEENPTGNTPEDKVLVFTYELDVTKVDGANDATKLEGAEFVLYRKNADDANEYAVLDVNNKVSDWTTEKAQATVLTSDAKGLFKVVGLDAGTYYLEETKAPAGYNLLASPIKVVIAAELETADDAAELKSLTITVDNGETVPGTLENGKVEMNVENNQGATLPETGGMGTTLLYIAGSILVVGAFVLMITKRRVSTEK